MTEMLSYVTNITNRGTKTTKTALAKSLGVSRSSLYYQPKRALIDAEVKLRIEAVLMSNPSYGHKRVALALKLNRKRIRRVMKLFNLKPYRRRVKKIPDKEADRGKPEAPYQNLIKDFCPVRPNVVWAADFTYIRFEQIFIYLATVMDLFTREIVGWNVSHYHNAGLVLGALENAVSRSKAVPIYFHSDQGSEYDSYQHTNMAKRLNIQISMSKKSSPWENSHQESFYSQFKVDLGHTDRFQELGELVAVIHFQLNYYNNRRIHTTLKTAPLNFKNQYLAKHCLNSVNNINNITIINHSTEKITEQLFV